jgi:hypothetical protein
MLVKINKLHAINPFWVCSVEESEVEKKKIVSVFVGRVGTTMGLARFDSDFTLDTTVKMINKGMSCK